MSAESVSLVVPVWNEEARLARNGPELARFVATLPPGSELIIADDGSADATLGIARRLQSDFPDVPILILEESHRGKGAVLRAGIQKASARVIAFCDVDLATPLDDLRDLIDRAEAVPALVLGSRDAPDSRLATRESAVREFLGKSYNRLAQALLVRGIRDTQCGAKAAQARVWLELLDGSRETGFALGP